MKILAIDSSGPVASVAVVTEQAVLAEYSVNFKKTHSQTLLPMIEEVLRMTETDGAELAAIAVTNGPGSYTGLRIGASTVKGLGLVWDIPIVPVPTAEALAANYAGTDGLVCPIMDARRGQVYAGIYRTGSGMPEAVCEQRCMLLSEVIDKLNGAGEAVTLLGDGVPVHQKELAEGLRVPYKTAPMHKALQSAASAGYLAVSRLKEGRTVSAMELTPDYLRQSQAEREREERLEHRSDE